LFFAHNKLLPDAVKALVVLPSGGKTTPAWVLPSLVLKRAPAVSAKYKLYGVRMALLLSIPSVFLQLLVPKATRDNRPNIENRGDLRIITDLQRLI
jgi:hypothetical protein